MPKIKRFTAKTEYGEGWNHYCPACSTTHGFAVEQPFRNGAKWSFDGNMDAPTFSPSMNIRIGPMPAGHPQAGQFDICHYFLRGGVIEFLPDCTHSLRGQRVLLPDLPPGR